MAEDDVTEVVSTKTEDVQVEATAPLPDAEKVIGIDSGACGAYDYVDIPDGYGAFDRAITVGGVRMEHVDTDADGVWLYRPM